MIAPMPPGMEGLYAHPVRWLGPQLLEDLLRLAFGGESSHVRRCTQVCDMVCEVSGERRLWIKLLFREIWPAAGLKPIRTSANSHPSRRYVINGWCGTINTLSSKHNRHSKLTLLSSHQNLFLFFVNNCLLLK